MFFKLQKACTLEIVLNDIFNQCLSRDVGRCCGWAGVWISTVKEMPHPNQTKERSKLPGCLAPPPPPPHPFLFFSHKAVLFGLWFSIFSRVSSQAVFTNPNNRNSRRASWCFSSWRHSAASRPTVTVPSSQKALNNTGIKKLSLKVYVWTGIRWC